MSTIGIVPAIKLKDCPCCGGAAVMENFIIDACVRCTRCGLKIQRTHKPQYGSDHVQHEQLRKLWNRRPRLKKVTVADMRRSGKFS